MDYTEYTAIKKRVSTAPNLCDLFKLISIETWKRMEFAYIKPGTRLFETTLTQNLIFTLNAFRDQYGLAIEIFEAKDEATNGNDIELIIRFPKEGLEFYAPIQAKKIYRSGKYKSMDHGVQIESLLRYSRTRKAQGFYLLYNFVPTVPDSITARPVELNGCTLISAQYLYENYYNRRPSRKKDGTIIEKWKIPRFADMHPNHAFSWHELVCPTSTEDLIEKLRTKEASGKVDKASIVKRRPDEFGLHKIGSFSTSNDWTNLKDLKLITDGGELTDIESFRLPSTTGELVRFESDQNSREFSPRTRLVLSHDNNN